MPLKNPEVYIFRAASLDRCTESGSGQQNRVRNFVPALCEGVALRYSLLHYPISGCPPELRPCRWGLGDKLTGCSFVPLRNLRSGHNSVPISRKKAAEQKKPLVHRNTHRHLHKPRRAALHFLWFFSERAGKTAQRAARGFSEKANLGLGIFIYRVPFRYRLRPQNLPCRQTYYSKMSKTPFAGFHHAQSKPLKNGRVRPCGICSKDAADQIEDTARTL